MKVGWTMKSLGDVCDIVGGGTPSKSNASYYTGNIPWASVRDMKSDWLKETEFKVNEKAIKESATNLIPKGNVVIATRVGLGKVCLLENDTAINQDLKGVVPKNGNIVDRLYLFHWFKSISHVIIEHGTGATVQGVKIPFIAGLPIPIPSLQEQRRIVAVLDEAFDSIAKAKDNAKKNLANTRELFDSYLQNVFAAPGAGWEETSLGEIYDVRDGTHDSPKYQNKGFPLVTSKNLKNDSLTFENIQYISEADYFQINQRSKVDKGDVLFAMIGTIGSPVVIETEPTFAIKNVALFKVPKNQNSYFLKYFLDSKAVVAKMASDAKGTTQKFVGLGYLRNFKIFIPSLTEQDSIVAELAALSVETQRLQTIYQKKLADLEELKKSILLKAFGGELVGARL